MDEASGLLFGRTSSLGELTGCKNSIFEHLISRLASSAARVNRVLVDGCAADRPDGSLMFHFTNRPAIILVTAASMRVQNPKKRSP
jgi:hypothetical protein